MNLSGLLVPRLAAKAFAARSPVDIALFGVGMSAAAGSVVFAVAMFASGDHAPMVNGTQYLGIFGRPNGRAVVVASADPAPVIPAKAGDGRARGNSRPGIDMSPVGSIVRGEATPDGDPYHLVAVEAGIAWLRNSVETRVIKPGDVAPGLGRVAAIALRDGRWTLLDDSGVVLIAAETPDPGRAAVNPFSRRMIFGGD
jgi:hypothetical protein